MPRARVLSKVHCSSRGGDGARAARPPRRGWWRRGVLRASTVRPSSATRHVALAREERRQRDDAPFASVRSSSISVCAPTHRLRNQGARCALPRVVCAFNIDTGLLFAASIVSELPPCIGRTSCCRRRPSGASLMVFRAAPVPRAPVYVEYHLKKQSARPLRTCDLNLGDAPRVAGGGQAPRNHFLITHHESRTRACAWEWTASTRRFRLGPGGGAVSSTLKGDPRCGFV